MKLLRDLQKTMKAHHLLALLGIVVVIYAIYQYSGRKSGSSSGFSNNVPTNGNGNEYRVHFESMPELHPPSINNPAHRKSE